MLSPRPQQQKAITSTLLVLAASTSFASGVSEESVNANLTASEIKSSMIRDEIHRRQVAWELAPVKTEEQLQAIIQKKSPLDLLSPEAKQRFVTSLVFTENGLGGLKYDDLEAELTPTQIHKVLSLFGAQHLVSKLTEARIEHSADALLLAEPASNMMSDSLADHKGYKCVGRATCEKVTTYICMSSCYH